MPRTGGDVCLATVVTDSFVPGAVVMLGSFRAHHPGFAGDVVVLHGGLSEASRTVLAAVGGRVRFEPVRPALLDQVARHQKAQPRRRIVPPQFYALDAFRLRGYRKVLFYDSDVLFQGPVDELFDTGAALLCCGDSACLRGQVRDAETHRPLERGAAEAGRPVLERPFNSGFLLIDESCTGERVYEELLAAMAPETWRGFNALTEQDVLNRYFAGRQTLVSWKYNYFVAAAPAIRIRSGLDAGSARALHFKSKTKPWAPDTMLRWARGEARPRAQLVGTLYRRWYDAYTNVLERTHLREARPGLAKTRSRAHGGARE